MARVRRLLYVGLVAFIFAYIFLIPSPDSVTYLQEIRNTYISRSHVQSEQFDVSSVRSLGDTATMETQNNQSSEHTSSDEEDDVDFDDDDETNRTTEDLIYEYEHGHDANQEEEDDNEDDGVLNEEEWEKMMEERFAQRRATVKAACEKYRGTLVFKIQYTLEARLLYCKRYDMMVCVVAKVRNMASVILSLSIKLPRQ